MQVIVRERVLPEGDIFACRLNLPGVRKRRKTGVSSRILRSSEVGWERVCGGARGRMRFCLFF